MNKRGFFRSYSQAKKLFILCALLVINMISCKDDYYYDEKTPEWLGESIYDYLKNDGNYNTIVKLIDDVEYTSVLNKTGSKTLFVADDAAFQRFYQNNSWGVSSYEQLTLAQKRLILNFSMINNAYLIETLSNYNNFSGLHYGSALRRSTAISVLDSINFESGDQLPQNEFWTPYRESGIHILKDHTSWPMVHFLQKQLTYANIDNADFKLITGVERTEGDAHIFNIKVTERDITCKNGYVHVLEDVLVPPVNIAEHINQNPDTEIFSSLLERFCAPYYDEDLTIEYRQKNPDFTDSLFSKVYFSYYNGAVVYPDGIFIINDEYVLPFNPGENSYESPSAEGALQPDMAAILAPTDNAMESYFSSGSGSILRNRYGSWENIPDDIAMLILRRHLRTSFLNTIPSRFDKMSDEENSVIPASISDLEDSYVGVNGVVYLTNKVYPPDDFVSVYGPVLFSENTKVFNWAIRQNDFRLYLNSLISEYSFFAPTDDFFDGYIDPVAFGKEVQGALKFWYNTETSNVNATVYRYDSETGAIGDSIGVITNYSFLSNRLLDLIDSHVVVGDVESGSKYYFTKGGTSIIVEGSVENLTVQGGGDIEMGVTTNVTSVYEQENGTTYFIDKPIQSSLQSVYKVLSETPEFKSFYDLLVGFPSTSESVIFKKSNNYYGIDYNIKFFNTYNYTIYVPTNDAIQKAISDGLISSWDMINDISDQSLQNEEIKKLERFLRYHFQDNSVYISGDAVNNIYQTATIKTDNEATRFNTYQNKYYKLKIDGSGNDLAITSELTDELWGANVITDGGLYNIMTRDYIFSNNPSSFSEIDGTGTGSEFSTSTITTSSTAVIHQIDNILRFE